jgi:ATP-binding cassette subfamily C protein
MSLSGKWDSLYGLLADLWKTFRLRYALLVFLMAVTGFLEGVTIAALVPLLSSMGIGAQAQEGWITEMAYAVLYNIGINPTPVSLAGLVLTALVLTTAVFILQARLATSMQTNYVLIWQRRLIQAVFGARFVFFAHKRTGDITNALINEGPRIGMAFHHACSLITSLTHGVIFIGISFFLSGPLTMIVIIGGISLFLLSRRLAHKAYRLGSEISGLTAKLQSLGTEILNGIKMIKSSATERVATEKLNQVTFNLRNATFGILFDLQLVKALFDLGGGILVVMVLIVGYLALDQSPATTLVILAIFVRLLPKITTVQQSLQVLWMTLPALDNLRSQVKEATHERELFTAGDLPEPLRSGPIGFTLRNVSLHYGDSLILKSVNLEVPGGSVIALVGASGSGKTSLADAVLGLAPLCDGEILINGIPLANLPIPSLRGRIGLMLQDTVVFEGSLRENIVWGVSNVESGQIDNAVRISSLQDVIQSFAQGYETRIGASGVALSGGERQRLGLARVLSKEPGLLILDEATNALDAKTEKKVIDSVVGLRGRATIFVIAHRLYVTRLADTICVLDNGEIVEQGHWEELMSRQNGVFRNMWTMQAESNSRYD